MVCVVLDLLYVVTFKLISCYVMYTLIHRQIVVPYLQIIVFDVIHGAAHLIECV